MKAFHQLRKPDLDDELESILESIDINEIAIKPQTARVLSYALLSRVLSSKSRIESERDVSKKIDLLAELQTNNAYLAILQIAIDQNDPTLLRKIRRR